MPLSDAALIDALNRRVPPTSRLLGARVLGIDRMAGTVRVSFVPQAEFCNPLGHVQGGFVAAMLDDAAGFAVLVKSELRTVVPTLELKTSFFAPAKFAPLVFAEGRCVRLGRRVIFMEADLFDADGKLLARLSASGLPMAAPDDATLKETV